MTSRVAITKVHWDKGSVDMLSEEKNFPCLQAHPLNPHTKYFTTGHRRSFMNVGVVIGVAWPSQWQLLPIFGDPPVSTT